MKLALHYLLASALTLTGVAVGYNLRQAPEPSARPRAEYVGEPIDVMRPPAVVNPPRAVRVLDETPRCGATTKKGSPCRNQVKDREYCWRHKVVTDR